MLHQQSPRVDRRRRPAVPKECDEASVLPRSAQLGRFDVLTDPERTMVGRLFSIGWAKLPTSVPTVPPYPSRPQKKEKEEEEVDGEGGQSCHVPPLWRSAKRPSNRIDGTLDTRPLFIFFHP